MPPQETGVLTKQLGSEGVFLARLEHDMRILGVIDKKQILSLTYLLISGGPSDKVRNEGHRLLADNLLHLGVGIGGRGRRDVMQGEAVMKGAQPNTEQEIDRPNIIARHTYARDKEREWKEQHGFE